MSIVKEFRLPAPVVHVDVTLEDDEDTLSLYDAKRVYEEYIEKDIRVNLVHKNHSQPVNRGVYLLAKQGEKLTAIVLLRALGYQARVLGDRPNW